VPAPVAVSVPQFCHRTPKKAVPPSQLNAKLAGCCADTAADSSQLVGIAVVFTVAAPQLASTALATAAIAVPSLRDDKEAALSGLGQNATVAAA
jgi:hypothetical protein